MCETVIFSSVTIHLSRIVTARAQRRVKNRVIKQHVILVLITLCSSTHGRNYGNNASPLDTIITTCRVLSSENEYMITPLVYNTRFLTVRCAPAFYDSAHASGHCYLHHMADDWSIACQSTSGFCYYRGHKSRDAVFYVLRPDRFNEILETKVYEYYDVNVQFMKYDRH